MDESTILVTMICVVSPVTLEVGKLFEVMVGWYKAPAAEASSFRESVKSDAST